MFRELGVRFGHPNHVQVLRTKTKERILIHSLPKPGHAPKRLGPHDLVTPVPRFEN